MATAVEIGQAAGSIVLAGAAAVASIRAGRSSRRVEEKVGTGELASAVERVSTQLGVVVVAVDDIGERVEHIESRATVTADRVEAWAERQADHIAWHQAGQPDRRARTAPKPATPPKAT